VETGEAAGRGRARTHALPILLGLALAAACAPGAPPRPDVILIVLDTTRADRLGIYGNPRRVSPEIDRFAGESVRYSRAWSTASWTLPAHASLLTGLYPASHGAMIRPHTDGDSLGDNPPYLPSAALTLAELLSEAGYRTGAFAAAGWLDPQFGLLQGYEIQDAQNFRKMGADEITDRASAWLETIPRDEPVHLLVNYFDPHDPYAPPPGFDLFPGARGPLPKPTVGADGASTLSAEARAALLARYDGEILFMDHHVGRLFRALRALDRYDSSLIVVTADHGELFGEHGAQGHGAWLWEEVLRIPLVVRFPGGRGGGAVLDDPTSLVDVLPLVAAEVEIALPEPLGPAPGPGRLVLATEYPAPVFRKLGIPDREVTAGIRWPWKLIVAGGEGELYRLDSGPGDEGPLHDPELVAAVREEMDAIQAELQPLPPDPDPHAMSPEARARLKALGYLD
jgi:arylsulfatase A-like enzyme